MTKPLEQAISDRRRALGNQYAYIGEVEEIAEIRASRRKLEDPYAYADQAAWFAQAVSRFDGISVDSLLGIRSSKTRKTDAEVERFVRNIYRQMWEKRADLFPDYLRRSPIDMLDPIAALQLLGYKVDFVGALGTIAGTGARLSNVAGLIDKASRQVLLATGLSPAVSNFTAAHELGHALMHEFEGMHRDKPMDGGSCAKDPKEREAELFATHFLMPKKLVSQYFEEVFGEAPFLLDEGRRYALSASFPSKNWGPKTLRDLSRVLGAAERFNGFSFVSLANRFRVSREAMAIRLEQLALVSLER